MYYQVLIHDFSSNMHVLAFVQVLVIVSVTETIDPCTNYRLIYEPHRSTAFVPAATDHLICDASTISGWYRFQGGNMATSCVQKYHCGTTAPIWLHGSHPTVQNAVVAREACVNYGMNIVFGGGTKCCDLKLNIHVKNCGTYYVYYLVRTPGCAMAYCIDNQPVCPFGKFLTSNHSCVDLYPKLTSFPTIGKPEIRPAGNVQFPCTVPYQTGIKDVGFEVGWTVDGQQLINPVTGSPEKTTLTGDQRIAYLDAKLLQGNLGKTLKCNVTSYHLSTPLLRSDSFPSNGYWVGIRTSKSRIVVDENGPEQELELESTLPITCPAVHFTKCKLRVEVKASNDPNDISTSSCVYTLEYDANTKTYRTTIKLKATRDFIDDKDKVHQLSFRPIFDLNASPAWLNYTIPSVMVKTKDKTSGMCSASGDPHFIGLDNHGMYNVYQVGDFLMYRSKKRPFEVHIRNWSCGGYRPCICSVVAREGNDVVQVDMCQKRRNRVGAPDVKFLSGSPLDGTTVSRDSTGSKFYINFPSGARLTVGANVVNHGTMIGYLNVNIQAPSDDYGATEGLCGTFDQNPNNDLTGADGTIYNVHSKIPTEFTKSWALKQGTSLFDRIPVYDPALKHQGHYCQCHGGVVDCTKTGSKNPSKHICGKKCIPVGVGNINGRREIYDHYYNDDNHDDDVESGSIYQEGYIKRKRSDYISRISRDSAQTTCRRALEHSILYNACAPSPLMDVQSFVDACVEDMQVSGSDIFVLGIVNAFDDACVDVIMRNVNNYARGPHGESVTPKVVTSLYCPNQCSMNGTCVHGNCVCNHGYTSIDCSVKIGQAPEILGIRGDSLCDVRKHPCQQANVIASNLMDVPQLQCRYRNVIFSNGKPHISINYTTTMAEFKTFLEVACDLPRPSFSEGSPVHGYMVSITTDGNIFSAEEMFVIYDGLCLQCNETGSCSVKNDSCLIDGQCWRNGEQNTDHQICKPSANQYAWTDAQGVQEIDHYTAYYTGCQCSYDSNSYDCACCKNGGCQCGHQQPNQCASCQDLSKCGQYPDLFPQSH